MKQSDSYIKDKILDFLISGHGVMFILLLIVTMVIYFAVEPEFKMYALFTFMSEIPVLLSYYWLNDTDE